MTNDTAVGISVTSHIDSISEMSCTAIQIVYDVCVCVCACGGIVHACLASYTHACKHSYNFKYMIVLPPCVCVTVRLHLFTHARRLVFFHPTQIQFYVRVCLFALQDSRDFHVHVQ